jgi:release factor glutamine methyltransferase
VNSPNINLLAVDRYLPALEVAKFNARQHHVVDRIQFIQSDLLSATSTQFDLICANLPYIPSKTLAQLAVARHEPLSALDGGPDGLRLIAALLTQAKNRVNPGGLILLEIESTQGLSAHALAQSQFVDADIQVLPDLAGHPRLLTIQTRN